MCFLHDHIIRFVGCHMRAPCAHVSKRTTGAPRNEGVLPCGLRASRIWYRRIDRHKSSGSYDAYNQFDRTARKPGARYRSVNVYRSFRLCREIVSMRLGQELSDCFGTRRTVQITRPARPRACPGTLAVVPLCIPENHGTRKRSPIQAPASTRPASVCSGGRWSRSGVGLPGRK